MSDFERTVRARTQELQQRYNADRIEKNMQFVARQADAERQDAKLKTLMDIGMQAVRLLVSRDVEPRTVWDRKVVGTHIVRGSGLRRAYSRELETLDWIEQGQGWEIYRTNHTDGGGTHSSAIGLQDNGRLFNIGGRGVPAAVGSKSKDNRPGLAVGSYMGVHKSEEILGSDDFLNGLTHRVNNWGFYTVDTKDYID